MPESPGEVFALDYVRNMTQTTPFPGRPHEYFQWGSVRVYRHPDLTLELSVTGLYWPGQVDSTWILFRERVGDVVGEVLGEDATVTIEMATVSGTRSDANIEDYGKLSIRGPREVIQKVGTVEGARELAAALDRLADDCGAQARSLDEQDGKLSVDIGDAFKAYRAEG